MDTTIWHRLLADDIFAGDLRRALLLVVLSLGIQLPVSLALAMLLNQPLRGRSIYRLVFFAPYVLSEVITAVLFLMVFSPSQGLADKFMGAIGLGSLVALAMLWTSPVGGKLGGVFS